MMVSSQIIKNKGLGSELWTKLLKFYAETRLANGPFYSFILI